MELVSSSVPMLETTAVQGDGGCQLLLLKMRLGEYTALHKKEQGRRTKDKERVVGKLSNTFRLEQVVSRQVLDTLASLKIGSKRFVVRGCGRQEDGFRVDVDYSIEVGRTGVVRTFKYPIIFSRFRPEDG